MSSSTGAFPNGAVTASDVSFAYGERQALRNVSFDVAPGGLFGFLGPNGSGKSTLFKLLSTIVPMQQGSITMLGHDLASESAAIRRRIGVVFQSAAIDRKLTVFENLRYAGMLLNLGGKELASRIDESMAAANLTDRKADATGELSGGLRRRVEIAKCLMAKPDLVLLDEASTGLDPAARREMWKVLRAQEGLTILFTTHLMDEAAEADRLMLLDEGQVVAHGRPGELMEEVGGQVLEIETPDAVALVGELRTAFKVDAVQIDQTVRIEGEKVQELVPEVMTRFGDRIRRLQLAHPSLEDVFLSRTGKRFVVTAPEPDVKKGRKKRKRS
ncbi:MAG: ABC-2 type transport system ATP-binding protein [Planctomycetota bacterium]|jgi:ABC-2 type transport system ATP-binding protein